jgi:ribosomal protein S18 acetylase RimI-like enzyme
MAMLQTPPTSAFTIRQVMPSDTEALVALLHDSFRTTWEPVVTPAAAKAYWESDRARCYVVEMGFEFRVALGADILAGMMHWRGDFVHALHVLSAWRRRGVATRLMDEAEARIAEAGDPAARLETDTFNHASQAFYRSRSYREVHRYPDTEWASGLTTLLLRKVL